MANEVTGTFSTSRENFVTYYYFSSIVCRSHKNPGLALFCYNAQTGMIWHSMEFQLQRGNNIGDFLIASLGDEALSKRDLLFKESVCS